jgi:hypothetical protein
MTKIIGYINANLFLPSPVIMVCQDDKEIFCVYPNCTEIRGIIGLTTSSLEKLKNFFPEKQADKTYTKNSFAYAFSSGEVFVGTLDKHKERLLAELAKPELPQNDRELIVELMRNEKM